MLISTSPSKCREMYTHNFEFVGMDSCRQRDLITCHLFCGLIWGIVSFWMYTIIISIEWHSELMWCWDAGWGDAALLWCSDAVWAGNRRLWGGGLLIAQCFCCWSHGREHTHELNITLSLSLSLALSRSLSLSSLNRQSVTLSNCSKRPWSLTCCICIFLFLNIYNE